MKLNNGNTQARGGYREGAGRKQSWVREMAQKITEDSKVLEFLGRVVIGIEKDFRITKFGGFVEVPPSIHDRIDACRELLDRGFGRPAQVLETPDGEVFPFAVVRPDDQRRVA